MLSDLRGLRLAVEVLVVLILVLMEYALWQSIKTQRDFLKEVLILVLMEYALWQRFMFFNTDDSTICLNPCSNGICSLTEFSLNSKSGSSVVLILVLMEYALWLSYILFAVKSLRVLILVLMEYALWQYLKSLSDDERQGLNPCSNGICSLTILPRINPWRNKRVLILVLMEYALWQGKQSVWSRFKSLNPCSNGICSLTNSQKNYKQNILRS